ncbi:uncharacterized protein LOC144487132 [Mustelus asterias]
MATSVQNPIREKLQPSGSVTVDAPASGQCANQGAKSFSTPHLGFQAELPSVSKPISLQVMGCGGGSWQLEVSKETSVRELQVMVAERSGVPADKKVLYLNNQTLVEGKVLSQYSPKSKSILMLVHKVYGG